MPRLKMTKLSSPLLRPKWAPDRVTPMPLVRPLVPLPVLEAARPPKVLVAVPGLALVPVTLPVPDRVTKTGPVGAEPEAALAQGPGTLPALVPAPVVGADPVAAINPAPVLATLTALVPAICRAEAVGTRSPFGDE